MGGTAGTGLVEGRGMSKDGKIDSGKIRAIELTVAKAGSLAV